MRGLRLRHFITSSLHLFRLVIGRWGVLLLILSIGFAQTVNSVVPGAQLVKDGPVRVEFRITKKPARLTIGDRLQMQLVVKHPKNIEVSPPFNPAPDQFVITSQRHKTVYQGDTLLEVYDLTMAIFAVGDVKLSPFLVSYQEAGGLKAAGSDSISLSVSSLLGERMADICDLKPQFSFPNLLPFWLLLGLSALGIIAFFGYRFIQRYRKPKLGCVPELPAWEEALTALSQVPVAEWVEKGQFKRLYYIVSEIIKRYLTRRFGFPAIDQTTTEIVRELKSRKIPQTERFSTFFYDADLVKYAKFVPSQPQAVVVSARELINLTIPREPKTPDPESGGC